MERVVSGIRSTGKPHLGSYFGAIKNFVEMQRTHDCFFFVADYHSLTTHPKAENLTQSVRDVLVCYLAAGLDPEKCTLYVQSDVPEIPELYLIFNMLAHLGELERSTTYKDKVAKQQDNINAGLLTYPVLMAVDIIIHKALKVPVGKDQEQHLEMTRNFANRFNHLYGVNYFPEPQAFDLSGSLIKVPGLDGTGKMGKSEGEKNAIFLDETEDAIRKKVMRAVTDTGPTEPNSPKSQPIENLFSIMNLVSSPETLAFFEEEHAKCTIRYGDLKKQLAEDIVTFTRPFREKIAALEKDDLLLSKITRMGAEKARASAGKTLSEVRKIIGINSLWK